MKTKIFCKDLQKDPRMLWNWPIKYQKEFIVRHTHTKKLKIMPNT